MYLRQYIFSTDKMKTSIIIAIFLCFSQLSMAQSKPGLAVIKTLTYCDHCKVCETCAGKMETELSYVKGIKSINYNESDMTIEVKYNPKKTSIETIRAEIAKLGFAADDIPADPAGYEKLDACCKKQ